MWADRRGQFRFVTTDTGNAGARFCGYPGAPDSVEDGATFVVKTVGQSSVLCFMTSLIISGLTSLFCMTVD